MYLNDLEDAVDLKVKARHVYSVILIFSRGRRDQIHRRRAVEGCGTAHVAAL